MTANLDKYYVSTFPGKNQIQLHQRADNNREGPMIEVWVASQGTYEIIKSYAKEIRDLLNNGAILESIKRTELCRLKLRMQRYFD